MVLRNTEAHYQTQPRAATIVVTILRDEDRALQALRDGELDAIGWDVEPALARRVLDNPEEYAGVHKTQDALMDRLITIHLEHYDRETEVRITMAKSGVPKADAQTIVDTVRELRGVGVNNHRPTIRACIAIARILARRGGRARLNDPVFQWVCRDVLNTDTAKVTHGGQSLMPRKVDEVMREVCGARAKNPRPRAAKG